MPYKDPEKERQSALERKKRYRQRQHEKRYGSSAGDMRGKHGNHARGHKNARWNDTKIISDHGYVKVRVGRDHPLADPNGYAYEHLVVWCSAGNPRPKANELLHHKNEDKQDNRIANIELIKRSSHAVHHNKGKKRSEGGRFIGKKIAGSILDGREHKEWPR